MMNLQRQPLRSRFWSVLVAFAMGMGGNLHLNLPGFGFVAMFDLAAYIFAIPILLFNWKVMGKAMRRTLIFSFAWTGAAMLANMFNFVEMRYWFKCVTIASSSWAIITCAYVMLRNCPTGYLWYLVGAGLSGWISLHYFRNGAYEAFATGKGIDLGVGSSTENLIDKQVYPFVAQGIIFGCVLPVFIWLRKLPGFFAAIGAMFAGFYLLFNGGSRSSFGAYCMAAVIGLLVLYANHFLIFLSKNRMSLTIGGLICGVLLFSSYKYMATNGILQEGEADKFENEFGKGKSDSTRSRTGFNQAIVDAYESGFLGKGWHLRNHSVMANSLACEGIAGFVFWIFFYWQILWFVSKRIPYSNKYATFIAIMVLLAAWDVFGSPFGTRHKFFVLMAFIALCKDYPDYGVGAVFDERVLVFRRR